MTETSIIPAPIIGLPRAGETKWEREYRAFLHLLPQLLDTHRGKYVAVHDGKVVDSGDDRLALALRVLSKVGNVAIHVGLVSPEQQAVSRSGVRREVRPGGELK